MINIFVYYIKRIKNIKANNASIIRTIYYNCRFLPKEQAKYLPMIIGKHTQIVGDGRIIISSDNSLKNSKIYIGCKALKWSGNLQTIISCDGSLLLKGTNIFIGTGSAIEIGKDAQIIVGDGFNITGKSTIISRKEIEIKQNVLISWDTLIMDSDAHTIVGSDGRKNYDQKIHIGEHTWISSKSSILPGSDLARNTIIGCGSVVKGKYSEDNCLITGVPAVVIKRNIDWNIDSPSVTDM